MRTASELDETSLRQSWIKDGRYEILPIGDEIFGEVLRWVPRGTVVHVMCPPADGADHSVRFAAELQARGFITVPHIASRTVRDRAHLTELVARLNDAGITQVFCPGGDGVEPAGVYTSAVELLSDLGSIDHHFDEIGVACYPEGHRAIPDDVLVEALLAKQSVATWMSSENCFDAQRSIGWLGEMRAAGVSLPLWVGLPGIVSVGRLLDAMEEYGLESAGIHLRNQDSDLDALVSRDFSPRDLIDPFAKAQLQNPELNIAGMHFFTFNEVKATEEWRAAETAEAAR